MLIGQKSDLFGNGEGSINTKLRNPNAFREAVIFNELRSLPTDKRKEFVKSEEARTMVNEGIISADAAERVEDGEFDSVFLISVCKAAQAEEDPMWKELVDARARERSIMNELIEKYGDTAKQLQETANGYKKLIPEYFRTNK